MSNLVRFLGAFGLPAVILGSALASGVGCSGSPDGSSGKLGQGGAGASNGSGSAQGGDMGIGGGFDPSTGSGSDGGLDKDAACASTSEEATLVPLNMFITVDKSGSMGDSNKYKNAKQAFTDFFNDPAAASLRVALRFWPDEGCDDSCNVNKCAQPQVDIGPLSDAAHKQALIDKFNAESPSGGTPMYAALGGAEQWATQYIGANPTEKVVVVLLTDGEPNGCDENVNHIAQLAADAYASSKVVTFAVGLAGSNASTMNTIAQAGQSGQAFMIGNGNASADLLAALKAIQKSQVACSFQMPKGSDPNKKPDPKQINVDYTPGGGGASTTIAQVSDAGACTDAGGWYYDDPVNPQTITLCPSTCNAVQADDGAKIEILLGCTTQVN